MIRIIRYLKPYAVLIAAAIVLLFGQANCDLSLPDYMSRIVNVGIQQGGIEDAVPEAIRVSVLDRIKPIVGPEGASILESAYQKVLPGSPEAEKLKGRYPLLDTEALYVLGHLSDPDRATLDIALSTAFLAAAKAAGHGGAGVTLSPEFASQAATRMIMAEYQAIGMDEGVIQLRYMLKTGSMMLLLTLLAAVATILVGFLSARIAAGLARDLRSAVFRKVESFSSLEFDTFSTASLITRSTNDVMQVQMVVMMMIRMVFYAPIIGIGGIIKAIGKDSSMWWVIALAVGILVLLISVVYKVAVPRFKIMQRLVDRLNLVSRESLSGMMVIRSFNRQAHEESRFDGANKDLSSNMLFVNRVMVVMMPVMMLIMNGVSLLIIWVGSHQVAQSSMQVGDMMAFMQYAMQIVFSFLMMSMMFIMLPRASVAADRIADVLETEPVIADPSAPVSFESSSFDGSVEFRGVRFRYPGAEEDVLHDISFTAESGQTTAIIGATGSGKSSVVSLIPRFYDVSMGSVLVGGVDVRTLKQADLRDKIGYVPQKASLFSGTIESNLRYADEEASEELIRSSASIAQATEFIESSPEGLSKPISQGGVNVSGGQKQRLSIARALVKRPPIYVFDDSFSALDFKTDAALRGALKEETGGSTVIIVTQRVSTVKNADRIVVLDEGKIAGIGTHRELLESCGTYKEIASSQLSEEELL